MTRQRIRLHTPQRVHLARLLTLVLALSMLWYGLAVVLLAVKVAPHSVNSLSAYRTAFHDASSLTERDLTTEDRLIAGFAGLVAFLVLVYVALGHVPRPGLSRRELVLESRTGGGPGSGGHRSESGDADVGHFARGATTVAPRAIERIGETGALAHRRVTAARGRMADGRLQLDIAVAGPHAVGDVLSQVRHEARASLAEHDLPVLPVDVDLTAVNATTRRELR